MKIEEFKRQFKDMNSIILDDEIILFKGFEIYDIKTEQSVYCKTFEEVLEHTHNDKTMQERIESLKSMELTLEGGRGASSGKSKSIFAGQGQHNFPSKEDFPARMNRLYEGNKNSQKNTLQAFRESHANAKKESAIMMDDNGFVTKYLHGGKSSVGFDPADVAGKHMVHNHPSSSNFSKADMDSFASTKMKSLTASGSKIDYTISKGSKFDAAGFQKAVNSAKSTQSDYNKSVATFLKQNQKKFGYTYKETKY